MKKFKIYANGIYMGEYEGGNQFAALDAYAIDAGYDNYDEIDPERKENIEFDHVTDSIHIGLQ